MSPTPLQVLSHYPAIPAPVKAEFWVSSPHACSYLPGRMATTRAIYTPFDLPPAVYLAFMDAGFRRSGRLIYQPVCHGCRACRPLRVPAGQFTPSKSQRRCQRRNADLLVTRHANPQPSEEKFALYSRYVSEWHGKDSSADDPAEEGYEQFVSFLYDSPVQTIEFQYRAHPAGPLLAVGICDLCPGVLSSVYFYFDPSEARRGLGTYGALTEIAFARERGIAYYYLGYWVHGCGAMEYKSSYRPHELLDGDGVWRPSHAVRR